MRLIKCLYGANANLKRKPISMSSVVSQLFSSTLAEGSTQCDLRRNGCYPSSRGKVWSVYSWSGMSFTAVEEDLIEEIRRRLGDWNINEYYSRDVSVSGRMCAFSVSYDIVGYFD